MNLPGSKVFRALCIARVADCMSSLQNLGTRARRPIPRRTGPIQREWCKGAIRRSCHLACRQSLLRYFPTSRSNSTLEWVFVCYRMVSYAVICLRTTSRSSAPFHIPSHSSIRQHPLLRSSVLFRTVPYPTRFFPDA